MPGIVGIVGSYSEHSKTRQLTKRILREIVDQTGLGSTLVDVGVLVSDLAVTSPEAGGSRLRQALNAIETADLLIAASPIYKGSYSGLFKHLIDLTAYQALSGVPVGLLAVGGSDRHALAVEHQFRPLFASFNANTLPTGVFVSDKAIDGDSINDAATSIRLRNLVYEAVSALRFRSVEAPEKQKYAAL